MRNSYKQVLALRMTSFVALLLKFSSHSIQKSNSERSPYSGLLFCRCCLLLSIFQLLYHSLPLEVQKSLPFWYNSKASANRLSASLRDRFTNHRGATGIEILDLSEACKRTRRVGLGCQLV